MRPIVVGYGSSSRAPPNSPRACFEAFDQGADAVSVDVCETADGVLIVGNRRTLRMLAPHSGGLPTWSLVRHADVGTVFATEKTRHPLLKLDEFFGAMGPLALHVSIDGFLTKAASEALESTVRSRRSGETTVLAVPEWFARARLPAHVPRVAILRGLEDLEDLAAMRADAIAASARGFPSMGRLRMAKVALRCDARGSLVAARVSGVVAVHTERPLWFRSAWSESPRIRL